MGATSSDDLLNYGFLRTQDPAPSETATILVVGLPRSGTSMVAAVLKELGVFIGERVDNAVFEDQEIAAALEGKDLDQLRSIIAARNTAHPIWGFKRPEAYKQLEEICALCRNPRIIVTFRDVLAISMRNNISMQIDAMKSLPQFAAQYQTLLAAIKATPVPSLLLSYEKAVQFPIETVTEIAAFCALRASPELISEAATVIENGNPDYVHAARLHYQGFIGGAAAGELRGWVKVRNRDAMRVMVELELDGQVVQTTVADQYRPDVERAGFGDGRYGFIFPITDSMTPGSVVRVRVQNSKFELQNSGRPLSHYLKLRSKANVD